MAVRGGTRVLDALRRPGVLRFSRYAVGSAVAFAASNVVFLLCYGSGMTSPEVASVLAFGVGIPVNYVLNRRWAWQRRGRPGITTELVPYAAVVSLSIVATAVGTSGADHLLASADLNRALTVVLVQATFIGINGGLFLAKYVLLDRMVFRDRPPTRRTDAAVRDVERVP